MHSNRLIRFLYPSCIEWQVPVSGKRLLYLTFDDGPHPDVTPQILDILGTYNVHATFFCTGNHVKAEQALYTNILDKGHRTGNHTFDHLNGWKTKTEDYLASVNACREYIASDLFRPPYGRITRAQTALLRKDYRIIMWSVLTGDYMANLNPEKCFRRSVAASRPGSIILFHDNLKSKGNVLHVLPQYIEYFLEKGYRFELL